MLIILLILLAFILNIFFLVMLSKLLLTKNLFINQSISFIIGFLLLIIMIVNEFKQGEIYDIFLYSFTTYILLGFCFFNIINSSIGSLRVRILSEFESAFPNSLGLRDLNSKYSNDEIFQVRLIRLSNGGQIKLVNNKFTINKGVVYFIEIFFRYLTILIFGINKTIK